MVYQSGLGSVIKWAGVLPLGAAILTVLRLVRQGLSAKWNPATASSYVGASENNPSTTFGGEKHHTRLDLWADGGIKSPMVLRPRR
ncbi:hypothetical protein U1Q18_039012 [Sarracenia purpurea var. burkii]